MDNLVIEKIGKPVGSGENGSSTTQAQTDLLKLLSQRSSAGLGSALGGLSGLGGLTAAAQARQNGCNIMRSYEALLQNSTASRIPPQAVTLPGPTRRRKKKRRRQPDMPKKACTPFMHFCAYFKRKLMEEGKEFPQFADFGKRAGELWRNMGEGEKQKFNELSEQDRQRYIKDMKEYEERKLAEKERERELQQQREQELQVLREKEMERLQKQQREQLEQQQKHLEQQKQSPNTLLNMINPLSHLSPLMLAALNQSLMQTMMANPELLKSMYSEAAKNYYYEAMKNIYQNASTQVNGNSPPVTSASSSLASLAGVDLQNTITSTAMTSNPLSSIGMNMNLFSLLTSSQLSSATNGGRSSPIQRASSPARVRQNSPLSSSSPVTNPSLALDLSAPRSLGTRGSCSSDEDHMKDVDGEI
ncbi:UNVERIFIED_CONTAM: hypothetical protein RMT77_003682 [Armadillidium vulgare]|nr:High mobility group protein DSP1 [Armadillidium vulgare]